MPLIYKITSPSNKVYIGQSRQWCIRKNTYKRLGCKPQVKIYRSLLKYGYENHIFEILEEFEEIITQDKLDEREIFWWKFYINKGFIMLNIKKPGGGGRNVSAETREKLSKVNKGRSRSPETLEKMRQANLGKKHSRESTLKMIATKKRNNKPVSLETRKKLSEALKGKKRPYAKLLIRPSTAKKVINIKTNQIYSSIKQAAKENNMTSYNLRNRLVGIVINNTDFRLLNNVCLS